MIDAQMTRGAGRDGGRRGQIVTARTQLEPNQIYVCAGDIAATLDDGVLVTAPARQAPGEERSREGVEIRLTCQGAVERFEPPRGL